MAVDAPLGPPYNIAQYKTRVARNEWDPYVSLRCTRYSKKFGQIHKRYRRSWCILRMDRLYTSKSFLNSSFLKAFSCLSLEIKKTVLRLLLFFPEIPVFNGSSVTVLSNT